MNLPNKLTVLRIILVPIFLIFLLNSDLFFPYFKYISIFIFIFASFTDALDGYIARKNNLITNFGKLMDPLADKLLVSSALIAMVELKFLSSLVVIIIIGREFLILGFRLIALESHKIIAASKFGKIKTIFQMIMVVYLLLDFKKDILIYLGNLLIILTVVFTIVSALDYIIKNIKILKNN